MDMIPFHKPIIPKRIETIFSASILNGWLTTGKHVEEFEAALCDYLNVDYVAAVSSCTAALHLALASKGFSPGDKFIVPTYTFVASVEVGEYLGMEPIFIDSDINNLNMNLDCLEDTINNHENVKAIIPVHFAGHPMNINRIKAIAEKYNLFILEDAAHSLESVFGNTKIGDTSYATAFSFYANKNITTAGEGGALATNDMQLYQKVKKLSLHGMSKDGWNRFKTGSKWSYDVSEMGFKYNMTDISASFGFWQLKQIDDWHQKRCQIVHKYFAGLSDIKGLVLPSNFDDGKHAWHLFIIRIIPEYWRISRDDFIEEMTKYKIGTSVHYKPIHMHSYYENKYGFKPEDYPNAKTLGDNVVTIPLYPALNDDQVDYIIDSIVLIWKKNKI